MNEIRELCHVAVQSTRQVILTFFDHYDIKLTVPTTYRRPSTSLHRVILLEQRLRLTRVLYGN
jgi:hypothetical protein